jgi:hypothetical protein
MITKIETCIKLTGKKSNDVLPAEIDDTSSDLLNFPATVVVKKLGLKFFLPKNPKVKNT